MLVADGKDILKLEDIWLDENLYSVTWVINILSLFPGREKLYILTVNLF